jgi:hypothetical protein
LGQALSGRIEIFVVNDTPRWQSVDTGHSLLVAESLKHTVHNTADQPADLILATNNRVARYFRDACRPGS